MFRAGGRVRRGTDRCLEQGEERDIQVFRAGGRVRRGTDRCVEQGAG